MTENTEMNENTTGADTATEQEKMNLSDLLHALKDTCPAYTLREYEDFLKIFRATIEESLSKGIPVGYYDFGVFEIKQNPDRTSSFTGEAVAYKGKKSVKFSLSDRFKKRVYARLNAA